MKRLIMSDSSVEWRIIPVEELRKWNLFSTMDDYFLQNIRLAHAHGMFGFLVTADDIVYVVGTNRKGALGIGGILEAPSPVKIDPLCGQSVKEFVIAGITSPEFASCFALTEDGRVFSWGSNSNGQLGTHGAKKLTTPELIKFDSNVKIGQISVGDLHTLALTEDTGEVYSCGWNAYGQLGLGTDTDQYEPRKITANFGNIRVKQISCSSSSSFALSESGEVYSWGHNGCEELGLGNATSATVPTKLIIDQPMKKIANGSYHTLALTLSGEIYACGDNASGQLGTGDTTRLSVLTKLSTDVGIFEDISSITGIQQSLGKVADKIFAWGEINEGTKFVKPTELASNLSNFPHCVSFLQGATQFMYKSLRGSDYK